MKYSILNLGFSGFYKKKSGQGVGTITRIKDLKFLVNSNIGGIFDI